MDGIERVRRDCAGVLGIVFLVSVLVSAPCFAADWSISPHIKVIEEYNDNVLFRADDELDDWVTYIRPRINAEYATQRFRLSLDSGINSETYSDHTKFNTVDQDHNLALSHSLSRTLSLNAGGYYRKDTTLETELLEEGLLVSDRFDREKFGGNLGFNMSLSRKARLSGNYARHYSEYDEGFNDRFADVYRLSPHYILSPKTKLFLNLSYTQTEYDRPGDPTIDNYRIDPSFRHDFAEDFYISGGAGYRYTEEERIGASDEDYDGFVFDLEFHRKWKRTSATLLVSKNQYSTVDRRSVDRDRVTIEGIHQLTKRVGATLAATYRRNRVDDDDSFSDDDSDYYTVSPGVIYIFTPRISLRGSVDYSEYDYDEGSNRDREQFRARVQLVMGWPRLLSGK